VRRLLSLALLLLVCVGLAGCTLTPPTEDQEKPAKKRLHVPSAEEGKTK
jgi:hypothetical protein